MVGFRSLSKNVIQNDRVAIVVVIKEDMQLTDEQWGVVEPLIPKPKVRKDRKGRPRVEARSVLDGMLWVFWTGAPWKALPSEYPPYQTVHRRMQEWVEARVFWRVLKALAADLRDRGKIDLTEAFIDGTHAGLKGGRSRRNYAAWISNQGHGNRRPQWSSTRSLSCERKPIRQCAHQRNSRRCFRGQATSPLDRRQSLGRRAAPTTTLE